MRVGGREALGLAVVAGLAAVAACVADEPSVATTGDDGGSDGAVVTDGSGAGDDAAPGDGGAGDDGSSDSGAKGACAPAHAPQMIATFLAVPQALDLDGPNVYVATGSSVLRVQADGGTSQVGTASGLVFGITSTVGYVAFTSVDEFNSIPKVVGSPVSIAGASASAGRIASKGDTVYYPAGDRVDMQPAGSAAGSSVLYTAPEARAVAHAGVTTYFLDTSDAGAHVLHACGNNDCSNTPPQLVETFQDPIDVVAQGADAFVLDRGSGDVYFVPSGSAKVSLAGGQNAATSLGVSPSFVYWVTPNAVWRAARPGTQIPPCAGPMATQQPHPLAVAADDTYVYWVTADDKSLWRELQK